MKNRKRNTCVLLGMHRMGLSEIHRIGDRIYKGMSYTNKGIEEKAY